ncbi:hypothetical protein TNCV_4154261 [Trichonephila clavipes]|nr:hypothetical protein TNCV_4154261 [Trichonephila clavipes]
MLRWCNTVPASGPIREIILDKTKNPALGTLGKRTATAGSDVVQSGRLILWPYMGNNTANVAFQMVKRLWLIRIDQ